MTAFFIGLAIGATLGLLTAALCATAGDDGCDQCAQTMAHACDQQRRADRMTEVAGTWMNAAIRERQQANEAGAQLDAARATLRMREGR